MWKLRLSVVVTCGAFGLTGAAGALADPGGQPNSNANPNAGGSSNASANSNAGGSASANGNSNASSNGNSNAGGNSSSHSNSNTGGKSHSHKGSHGSGKSGSNGKSNHTGPGDSNAGDVWLDNVGQPAGPGHEMDPHLACQDINLWGDKLADSSGTYTIDGWPPSGSKKLAYSGNWTYDTSKGGDQVTSVINVTTLIDNAAANGDTPAKQGYHFKLNFSQDPQKHKVFWVKCSPPSSPSTTSSPSGTSSPTTQSSTTTSSGPTETVKATHVRRVTRARRHHRRRHHLLKPRRRHHVPRRSVKAVSVTAPAFTG